MFNFFVFDTILIKMLPVSQRQPSHLILQPSSHLHFNSIIGHLEETNTSLHLPPSLTKSHWPSHVRIVVKKLIQVQLTYRNGHCSCQTSTCS